MSDYISREAAYNAIVNNYTVDDQLQDLCSIPAADVAEVVRCGECAWWQDRWQLRTELGEWHYCADIDIPTPKDFYCAFGEKRQESGGEDDG